MKVKVSGLNFVLILTLDHCFCVHFLTPSDHDVHPEPATFGVASRDDEFPFMTALGWWNGDIGEVEYLCGGMLISPSFVLTAAHCLFIKRRVPNLIKIGGNRLNSTHNEEHTVRGFFIHPGYDDSQGYDDVALLLLKNPSRKPPVCLWARPTLETLRATALGYGATHYAGSTTTVLQKVNLVIVSTKVCTVYHERKRKFQYGLLDGHLCAGDPGGRQDTCDGDSGGPLIVKNDYREYAVGIISNGQACFGFPPAIYTRISSYIRWIDVILQLYSYTRPRLCF